jgi:hypothetical protein
MMLKLFLAFFVKVGNAYFKRAFCTDFLFSLFIAILSILLENIGFYKLPKDEFVIDLASEVTSLSLGASSLFLTILTLIIAFKNSIRIKDSIDSQTSLIDVFFSNKFLYGITISNIRSCLGISLISTILGFVFRMVFMHEYSFILFYFSCFASAGVCLSYFRITLILFFILKKDEV